MSRSLIISQTIGKRNAYLHQPLATLNATWGAQRGVMRHSHSILAFFWHHIKPYKWHYAVMMMGPVSSAFYNFIYNYAIKLIIDILSTQQEVSWSTLAHPIILYVSLQVFMEFAWRIGGIAAWRSEPYVRRSIFIEAYDYVQHHSYIFFQNHLAGTLSSRVKGIWDGYDQIWAEVRQGIFLKILQIMTGLTALYIVNHQLALFVSIWCLVYSPIVWTMSRKISKFSEIETESRHSLMGRVADNFSNILSLLSFAARSFEKSFGHTRDSSWKLG